jgi:hypothetical protein
LKISFYLLYNQFMRKVLFLLGVTFFFFIFSIPVFSDNTAFPRLASCDLCGYCQGKAPPQNWEKCRACLYPNASSQDDTLKVDPETNLPPTPYPGRWYTFLGCISTNLGSFESPGATASVVQLLLNIIFSFVGGASLLSLLYGAFILLTSQNNPEKINQGKRIVFGAIAGLIFTFLAVFLVNFLGEKVLRLPGFTQ